MGRWDQVRTVNFDEGPWLPPVETIETLWPQAGPGQLCFVKSEDKVYERTPKGWRPTELTRPRD